jgi:hypothetical protein
MRASGLTLSKQVPATIVLLIQPPKHASVERLVSKDIVPCKLLMTAPNILADESNLFRQSDLPELPPFRLRYSAKREQEERGCACSRSS